MIQPLLVPVILHPPVAMPALLRNMRWVCDVAELGELGLLCMLARSFTALALAHASLPSSVNSYSLASMLSSIASSPVRYS